MDIEGDLLELYRRRLGTNGSRKAKWLLFRDVLLLFRPGIIRPLTIVQKLNFAMFQHNIILAIRNFSRNRLQFLINLTGLSTGLACVLFIMLWIQDEVSTDHFHENDAHLYQIMSNQSDASGVTTWRGVPGLLLDYIEASVPEVKIATAFTDPHEFTLSAGDQAIKADGLFASEQFMNAFTYPMISGNHPDAEGNIKGIAISETLANNLFRSTDVIGERLSWHFWGQQLDLQVTGVMKDLPSNSSQQFDFVMSWLYYHDDLITYKQWGNYYARIGVVLHPEASVEKVNTHLSEVLHDKQESDRVNLFLASYSGRYLYGKYQQGVQAGGRIEYVRIFAIIGLFILAIACFNFINLSTAKAAYRTKEIGVKKSLGASRRSLAWRYFTESLLLSALSIVLAIVLVALLLPQFNVLSQKELTLALDGFLVGASLLMVLIVGLLAGSYPALYLSGFRILDVLKGKLTRNKSEGWSRNALVAVQFSLSILMIVAVFVIHRQMDFVQNMQLGYDRDNVIYFEREGKLLQQSQAFLEEVRNLPGISHASLSGFMVGGGNSTGGVAWPGKTDEDQIQFWETQAGVGLIEMLGIEVIEGRAFSEEVASDSTAIILNETAIKAMGLEDPIGTRIWHYTGNKKVIGVVKDFHLLSLHTAVEPMLFLYRPDQTHFIMAKLESGRERESIDAMEKLYTAFNPGFPFEPRFVDQDYQAQYAAEERVATLSTYFAGFAILISCLGLFGLASFAAERRTKEIGIRKILGSGINGIVALLMTDFLKVILVAVVVALPVSYIVASRWLEGFAYSINLEWWFFAAAGLAALIIAGLTIGMQTWRAAMINPVESLRDE